MARAAALDFPALAILDRDNISGAARFHMAAKKAGIRAHIGAEITCTDGHRYPLLAENRTGYQNLCRLITRMKMRAKKGEGAATPEEFAEFSQAWYASPRAPIPASSICSAQKTFSSSSSATTIAPKKRSINPSWISHGIIICRWWLPTA